MSKRRPVRRKSGNTQKRVDHDAWIGYINTGTAKNLALVAGAIGAIFYLNSNVFQPIYESGPPPFPARAEVDKLRKDSFDLGSNTLELAKAANVAAQQAVQTGNQNRLDGLLARKVQLDALIAMNPSDTGLKLILEQTVRSITELSQPKAPTSAALTGAQSLK